MYFFKNNFRISLVLICVLIGSPAAGMKRSVEESNPLAIDNLLALPQDVLYRFIKILRPAERNTLCLVSTLLRALASKSNINALASKELLATTHLDDILFMLDTCLSTNNVACHTYILNNSPIAIHPCYHRRMLLDKLGKLDPKLYELIIKLCPDHDFKDVKQPYNQVLFIKAQHLSDQDKEPLVTTLTPFLDCTELSRSIPLDFLRALGNKEASGTILRNMCTNQHEAIAEHIEKIWTQHKTGQQYQNIRWHCTKLLRYATILNHTNMVKAIVNTIPLRTHFSTDERHEFPVPTVPAYIELYKRYCSILQNAIDYSNREIWHIIGNWAEPGMNTLLINTPVVDDFIERGQYWYTRALITKHGYEYFLDGLTTAINRKLWSRVDGLSTVFDTADLTFTPIDNPHVTWILYCKDILHKAGLLPASLPGEITIFGNDKIKELASEKPDLFAKVHAICHRILTGQIKSTIQIAIDNPSKTVLLTNYLEHHRSTLPLVIAMAQELKEEYAKQLTTTNDLEVIKKIQDLEALVKELSD